MTIYSLEVGMILEIIVLLLFNGCLFSNAFPSYSSAPVFEWSAVFTAHRRGDVASDEGAGSDSDGEGSVLSRQPPPQPEVIRETAPEHAFPVWDDNSSKICLLAKFQATFIISYTSNSGDQKVTVHLPREATTKGRCGTSNQDPVLQLTWPEFRFTVIFTKVPLSDSKDEKADTWAVSSLELKYDTGTPIFDGATNVGKKTAKSEESPTMFETPMNKSYYCPSPEVVELYDSKNKMVATVKLNEIYLQPYGVKNGQFSEEYKCDQMTSGRMAMPFVRDETVPIAVGSTMAVLTLCVVMGFAIYRAVTVRRVEYNTME